MLRSTFLALLIFTGVAVADVQTGIVRSGGQPIPGATVTSECGADKITTTTDDAGRFEMGGLPSTSCKYTVLMFGFDPLQKDSVASSTPLGFDLNLQTHASIPVAPSSAPVAVAAAPAVATPVAPAAPAPAAPLGPMPSLAAVNGRAGGRGAQTNNARGAQASGRGGQANARGGQGGFQNLSLTQNGDTSGIADASLASFGGADTAGGGAGASDAFTVNGTLSQGVQAQAGDGFGMGGPGGFGFGPGGPGGDFGGAGFGGGPGGGRGGPGGDGGARGGPGGDGGGRGGFAGGGPGGGPGGGFGGGPGGGGFGGGRGGPGGPGGRGGGPNGVTSFGNRAARGRGPQWRASVNYNFANSALNARPYSYAATAKNGEVPAKAATANNQFGITLGGPIMIPKTKFNLKNSSWNLNYSGSRNRQGSDLISNVPTNALRGGDFSSLLGTTTIYDPSNGQPFANNVIPTSRLNSAALGLLQYIPIPTGTGLINNYELIATNPSNSNNLNLQLSDPLTAKDRLNVNLSYQSRDSSRTQNFGYIDPTNGSGKNLSVSYSRTIRPTMVNNFSLSVNRNVTDASSFFSNGTNVAGQLGINGVLATPPTYGPPTLSFTNFTSLNDGLPSANRSTTYSATESITDVKGKHNLSAGLNVSERLSNSLTANSARGSFAFSGVNTQLSGTTSGTGYDFADFLLGLPASTSVVQYLNGNDMFYYRQKTFAAYINDDWRVNQKLTVNLGLRWEFYGPETEKNNRMANLDFSPSGTDVAVVSPGQTSPFSPGTWPTGLINPDYRLFEPSTAIAWKPITKRPLVIRGGYGIRYNGQALTQLGSKLSIESPFVTAISLTSTSTPGLTLQNGFNVSPAQTILNSFGVSRDYKPAMAQQWNAIAQYTLGRSYVVQMTYNGIKGTDLDVLQGPNRATPGPAAMTASRVPIQKALSTIQYDQSIGSSIYHSGSAQITRRFARGLSGSATYTLAKMLDDSSTLGAGVVQIENNIAAERAVSALVPHQTFALVFNYQTLVGNQKNAFYMSLLRGWQLFGIYNVTSGTPFTATVAGDPSNTGVIGSTRANATGLPVEDGSGYFNPAAFTTVASGTYGNAGRNTIPGIVNFTMTATAMRSFTIGERHRLALTFSTINPLNHPSVTGINTVIGTPTVGQITSVSPNMRSVTAQARFTF